MLRLKNSLAAIGLAVAALVGSVATAVPASATTGGGCGSFHYDPPRYFSIAACVAADPWTRGLHVDFYVHPNAGHPPIRVNYLLNGPNSFQQWGSYDIPTSQTYAHIVIGDYTAAKGSWYLIVTGTISPYDQATSTSPTINIS